MRSRAFGDNNMKMFSICALISTIAMIVVIVMQFLEMKELFMLG